jgi:hypothetical protein
MQSHCAGETEGPPMHAINRSMPPAMSVWVERANGSILRGTALKVSARSAQVRLAGHHEFRTDELVLLRICFSPERPTVAASAQVRWARPDGDSLDCGLDWDLGTVELETSCPA